MLIPTPAQRHSKTSLSVCGLTVVLSENECWFRSLRCLADHWSDRRHRQALHPRSLTGCVYIVPALTSTVHWSQIPAASNTTDLILIWVSNCCGDHYVVCAHTFLQFSGPHKILRPDTMNSLPASWFVNTIGALESLQVAPVETEETWI